MLSAVAPSILANRRWVADPQASTAVAVAMLVAAGLVLTNVVRVPLPLVAVAALVAAPVLPRFRRLLATATERLMFADIRARSSASALETERARVAREIHDSPLQELSGVIRKLDLTHRLRPKRKRCAASRINFVQSLRSCIHRCSTIWDLLPRFGHLRIASGRSLHRMGSRYTSQ